MEIQPQGSSAVQEEGNRSRILKVTLTSLMKRQPESYSQDTLLQAPNHAAGFGGTATSPEEQFSSGENPSLLLPMA